MKIIIMLIACSFSIMVTAQLSNADVLHDTKSMRLPVCSNLWNIGKTALLDPHQAIVQAKNQNMQTREDGKIYIQIADGWDTDKIMDPQVLATLGVEVQDHFRNAAGCWVSPSELISLAQRLPQDFLLRSANMFSADHEGVVVTNSLSYKNTGGANGQGVKIAIIDLGYTLLTNAQAAGTAPDPPASTYDWTGSGLMVGTTHGTGCTEITFEYANQATYYLHKINGDVQLGLAINQAIADNVDLITSSISYYNTGWADGTGLPCAAVKDATDAGILFFHGSGNFNQTHYQGDFLTTDGDDWHEYNGSGDETNQATVTTSNNTINVFLQWQGNPAPANDFDLYLFNATNGNVLASAVLTNDFEYLSWTNNTGSSVNVEVAVLRYNSNQDDFEVFVSTGQSLGFNQTGSSSASPSNSLEEFCITVGAINNTEYDDADPQAESFSSRGPTNSGNIVPDLIAPDNLTLVAYPNGFSGSSAGGPNTCGLTAVLWSEHDYLSATGIKELVRGLAALYNDWGDPGKDNTYGEGGLYLPDFVSDSRFIYKGANNINGLISLPFYSMEQANTMVHPNSNVFFLGETHDPPAGIISTPMIYRSLVESAITKD